MKQGMGIKGCTICAKEGNIQDANVDRNGRGEEIDELYLVLVKK